MENCEVGGKETIDRKYTLEVGNEITWWFIKYPSQLQIVQTVVLLNCLRSDCDLNKSSSGLFLSYSF